MQAVSPLQRYWLLESYLLTVIHTALARGRPAIDCGVILEQSEALAQWMDPPGNVWMEMIQRSMVAKGESRLRGSCDGLAH